MKHTFFPLDSAYLCAGCDCVSDQSRNCPACGSSSLLCLSRVLNPPEGPSVTPERVQRTLDALERLER
jgi:hypothetical protein